MSLYVKLSRPHRHNGRLCKPGDKLRIPTATALAMTRTGRAVIIEGDQLIDVLIDRDLRFVERDPCQISASLQGEPLASVIDNDLAHRAPEDRQEVSPIGTFDSLVIVELEVCLVDQDRGVEGMTESYSAELAMCDPQQIVVQKGDHVLECVTISFPALDERLCEFAARRSHRH